MSHVLEINYLILSNNKFSFLSNDSPFDLNIIYHKKTSELKNDLHINKDN